MFLRFQNHGNKLDKSRDVNASANYLFLNFHHARINGGTVI